jgi:hypothetical protein
MFFTLIVVYINLFNLVILTFSNKWSVAREVCHKYSSLSCSRKQNKLLEKQIMEKRNYFHQWILGIYPSINIQFSQWVSYKPIKEKRNYFH